MIMVDGGILDQVTQEFLEALKGDASHIATAAQTLFMYLVIIQITLSALWMTLSGESTQRFLSKMVQLVFSFGFFYTLMQVGGQWVPDIINGFVHIGENQGVTSLDPSSILSQGVSISGAILKGFFNTGLLGHLFVSIVGAAVCIAILVIYALIAAELAIALVKSYVLVAVGGLFFAFGGSDYTRDMAINYFKSTIGLGLKLMTLYLLIGVGQNLGNQWATMTLKAASQHALMPMLVILAAVIVYYLILKNIPPFVAGLSGVGGFRNYGDAAVGMAINAGATGASALSRTVGQSGKAVQGLTQLGVGGAHVARAAGHGFQQGDSLVKSFGKLAGTSASHLVSASANTVKDMALKQNQHLSFGQKMNHHLSNKLKTSVANGAKNDEA